MRETAEESRHCRVGYVCVRQAAFLADRCQSAGRHCIEVVNARGAYRNKPPRVAETASGIINSVGLQNPGVDAFLSREMGNVQAFNTAIIANIAGSAVADYVAVIEKLNDTSIDFYELNISCPNVKEGGASFGTDPELTSRCVAAARAVSKNR